MKQTSQSTYSRRPLRTRQISSSFEPVPYTYLFVESADFICQLARSLAQFRALLKQSKQAWMTDCVKKTTTTTLYLEGSKAKTIEYKFEDPAGISSLPVLDVAAVWGSSEQVVIFFKKNGHGVLAINLPSEITPVHWTIVPWRLWKWCFSCIKPTNILHNIKVWVTLDNSGDSRISSTMFEQIAARLQLPRWTSRFS